MSLATTTRRRLLCWLGAAPIGLAAAGRAEARPARSPVKLLYTRVNGEHYYEARAALADLAVGAPVTLRREPTNAYDRRAVEVLDRAGRKLGYVARIDNSALARLIDAGERFEARVARLDPAALDIRLQIDWLPGRA